LLFRRKIYLEDTTDPAEPLKSILNCFPRGSKYCLYNLAFQMTSFGTTEIKHENIPTFQVKGQVYHLTDSLSPGNLEKRKV
jgi:hypothetical protein